jgi:hypothetical protein
MLARDVVMDRGIFEAAAPLLNRQLAYEITRFTFGTEAEFRRRAADDAAIQLALRLADGATTQPDLFARATGLPGAATASRAAAR